MQRSNQARTDFEISLDDDLNTAEALAAIFEYIRDVNSAMDSAEFLAGNVADAAGVLQLFDDVFDVIRPTVSDTGLSDADIEKLITERQEARRSRNFQRSDEIRAHLLEQGIVLEDTKDGARWKRK